MQLLHGLSLTDLTGLTPASATLTLAIAWSSWAFARGVYNVWFHPLAKYPGPRFAAWTIWWRAYVELFEEQNLVDRLFDLHREYGTFTESESRYPSLTHM